MLWLIQVSTSVHYRFSYEVACWLARYTPDTVDVDWLELDSFERLDEILRQIAQPSESDYYTGGRVSERKWIARARGNHQVTDFTWLMSQIRGRPATKRFWAEMYDAADLPLSWRVGPDFAKGRNVLMWDQAKARPRGMRRLEKSVVHTISRPLRKLRQLPRLQGVQAVNVAMAALAVRHRETYHFNHANPEEVYEADVGEGVKIFVYGLLPQYRFSLETTMGYLIVANGIPIGYGGASAIFRQANTGINVFDEFRGSEAAHLWVQVLRTFHHLFGCKCFVVNPYQIGADNKEALHSGAFWFYYRLGFRPAVKEVARLATSESTKFKTKKDYRTDIKTLKQLTQCDMHLRLIGWKKSDFFEENWLEICAATATDTLGKQKAVTRTAAARETAIRLVRLLGQKSYRHWPKNEQRALLQQAPVMNSLPDLGKWTKVERTHLLKLMRAKGSKRERDYIKMMNKNDCLRRSLSRYCRGVASKN